MPLKHAGCPELAKIVGDFKCCPTCHNDDEDYLLEVEHDGVLYVTCCDGKTAFGLYLKRKKKETIS